MDFKKVLDQTVRELKREVNKKVLKVPEIEQKVLDATSNEPWGPHGTAMGEIAHATRNYYEYQMIITIIWKRLSDTGRNWRHVYKALTLLEYLVAHGSERVIDDIKENHYRISALADFQFLEPNGKDQGINVRKKSQTLLSLVNDKEKIREVRQKAVENRDKYRGLSSTGGMHKPSSYQSTGGGYSGDRYEEDGYGSGSRYGGRDDDKNSRDRDVDRYKEDDNGRDWDHKDNDRSGREGDCYKSDYKNNDYEDNARRGDDRQSEKYRGYDKDLDRSYDDDDRHSSRSGGGRDDEYRQDDWRNTQKPHNSRVPAPPSYEEAQRSPDYLPPEEPRGGGNFSRFGDTNKSVDDDDDFDPRASSAPKAAPPQPAPLQATDDLFASPQFGGAPSNNVDFFGDSSTSNFASVPVNTPFQESSGDVFGNSPFKVEAPFVSNIKITNSMIPPPPRPTNPNMSNRSASLSTTDAFGNSAFKVEAPAVSNLTAVNSAIPPPPSAVPTVASAVSFSNFDAFADVPPPPPIQPSFPAAGSGAVTSNTLGGNEFDVFTSSFTTDAASGIGPVASVGGGGFDAFAITPPTLPQATTIQSGSTDFFGANPFNSSMLASSTAYLASQTSSSVPSSQTQNIAYARAQADKKFETKSTVWADSLSKGLIDLNISGPKTNPLGEIGIDFDLLRTERKKEERITTNKVSPTNMGKAMGSGSGLGVAGAGAIPRPPTPVNPVMGMNAMGVNPMMGMNAIGMRPAMMQMELNPAMRPGMGMGMGMGTAPTMGMGANPSLGMGGFPNQQQQYNGFM